MAQTQTVLSILEAQRKEYGDQVQSALAEIRWLEAEAEAGIFNLLRRHSLEAAQTKMLHASIRNTTVCDLLIELRMQHLI